MTATTSIHRSDGAIWPSRWANLWRFACGRGNHEKEDRAAEDRAGLPHRADDGLCCQQRVAAPGGAACHNLLTNFQIETGAARRARTNPQAHRASGAPDGIATLRFVLFNRAAQIVRPGGTLRLRLADNAATRRRVSLGSARCTPGSSPEFLSHQGYRATKARGEGERR